MLAQRFAEQSAPTAERNANIGTFAALIHVVAPEGHGDIPLKEE